MKQDAAFDIHNQRRAYDGALRLIDAAQIGARDQELLKKFLDDEGAGGIGILRQTKAALHLLKIRGWLGKPFEDAGEADFKELVNTHIENGKSNNGRPYAPWSKRDFKVSMVKFYRWLRKIKKGRPPELDFMDLRMKERDRKLPDSLLSDDEIKLLIRSASTPKEKAFVSVLSESGTRIAEFLCIRLRDITFDKMGAVIQVSGKTGARRVRLISSAPYLMDYVQNYHAGSKPESPLWPSKRSGNTRPLCYQAACKILRRIAAAAGIMKATNPHNFRHSRATELAKHLTEQQMKAVLGWTPGSDMASVYVHLSGQDTDDALLEAAGMKVKAEDAAPKVKACPVCRTANVSEAKYCINKACGVLLDALAWKEAQEQDRQKREAMFLLIKALEKRIAEIEKTAR